MTTNVIWTHVLLHQLCQCIALTAQKSWKGRKALFPIKLAETWLQQSAPSNTSYFDFTTCCADSEISTECCADWILIVILIKEFRLPDLCVDKTGANQPWKAQAEEWKRFRDLPGLDKTHLPDTIQAGPPDQTIKMAVTTTAGKRKLPLPMHKVCNELELAFSSDPLK